MCSKESNPIHPIELLSLQFYENKFVRWDTIIRYIAARHFIETGEMHYLYEKDCKNRHLFVRGTLDNYDPNIGNYKKHIKTFIKNGRFLKGKTPISVNNKMLIFDGTHRLGVSLAMGLRKIYYRIEDKPDIHCVNASLDYYKKNFTNDEINLLIYNYKKLMEKT